MITQDFATDETAVPAPSCTAAILNRSCLLWTEADIDSYHRRKHAILRAADPVQEFSSDRARCAVLKLCFILQSRLVLNPVITTRPAD
jgi:hypothetical protein